MFLTRPDDFACIHEPFCDAYHFGPERLSERYTEEQVLQEASSYENSTYGAVLENIWRVSSEVRCLRQAVRAQWEMLWLMELFHRGSGFSSRIWQRA